MRRTLLAAFIVAALAVPAASAKKKLFIQTEQFDAAAIAWASGAGSASIKGSAVLRTQGGDAKTCAGSPVLLIPVSAYSTERMVHEFGENVRGLQLARSTAFASTDPAYLASMRKTRCDAQGAFEFSDLPKGAFYIITTVAWGAPSRFGLIPQGGELLERVDLHEGDAKQIVLGE